VLLYCFWYFKLRKPAQNKKNPIPEKKEAETPKTEVTETAEKK
jgi:hypothetical protein